MNMSAPEWRAAREKENLWRAAPGWRRLVLGASGLTALAIALPLVLRDSPPPASPPVQPAASAAPVAVQAPSRLAAAPAQPQIVYVPRYITVPSPSQAPAQPPVAQPRTAAAACDIRVPETSEALGAGTVVQIMTEAGVRQNIEGAQASSHGLIDPAYAERLTVGVKLDSGLSQVGRAPPGMTVHVGDRVTMQGWYRNVALPCNYIPNTVIADLGPPQPTPAPGQP